MDFPFDPPPPRFPAPLLSLTCGWRVRQKNPPLLGSLGKEPVVRSTQRKAMETRTLHPSAITATTSRRSFIAAQRLRQQQEPV